MKAIKINKLPLTTAFTSARVDEQLRLLQLFNRNQYSLPGIKGPWPNRTSPPSPGSVKFPTSLQVEPLLRYTIKNWSSPPLNPEIHVPLMYLFVKFRGVCGLSETHKKNNIRNYLYKFNNKLQYKILIIKSTEKNTQAPVEQMIAV